MKSFYDLQATRLNGQPESMDQYRGKTIIVVNTASKCGLTPQYEGLEELYQKYKDRGLVVLGFPCNQFGAQEPGDSGEISEFCRVNYGVSFPMFEKVDVNGRNAHPIFKFLTRKLRGFLYSRRVKWNFTKFVIDKKGYAVKRFSPVTTPQKMQDYIESIL